MVINLFEKNAIQQHEYPKIEGKLKSTFNLPSTLINKLHIKMNELYTNSNVKNPVVSTQVHNNVLELFIQEYYPLLSRNIKTDNHNMVVIMGGSAYNINIPNKMMKILHTPTDDIDMKVYTTDINSLVKQPLKLTHVLSIFKYLIVIISLYMKLILTEIIEYSRNSFETYEPYIKRTMKNTMKNTSKSKKQNGGDYIKKDNHLIKLKQRRFGVLKSYKIKLQIKKTNDTNDGKTKEIIDITDLSYEDTYKLIMSKLDDPDIMITTKISYSFKYINLIVPYNEKSRLTITFSDTKIIYPSIENPLFFSYYFMNMYKHANKYNIGNNTTLETLLKQNINISDIIDTKPCKNNCRYISIKCLQIDLIYMLRFAELIENEDILNGDIIVPVGSLFKYYKYMIKFIRIHIIKKFFNGTLSNNKAFIDSARKLIRFVEYNLIKETNNDDETLPINVLYKNIISNFHQAFFIKKTMFPEYEALREIVNDYNTTVNFINKSCALFKKLDDEKEDSRETIDSLSIQYAVKKINDDISEGKYIENNINNMEGGKRGKGGNGGKRDNGKKIAEKINKRNKKDKIILHSNYSYEDPELDEDLNKINNTSKSHKYKLNENKNKIRNKVVIDKLHKMLTSEIKFLGRLSHSIKI